MRTKNDLVIGISLLGIALIEVFFFIVVLTPSFISTLPYFWYFFGGWMSIALVLSCILGRTNRGVDTLFWIAAVTVFCVSISGEIVGKRLNFLDYPMLPGWLVGVSVSVLILRVKVGYEPYGIN